MSSRDRALRDSLLEACHKGDSDQVARLLQRGAPIDATNPMNNWSALHWAAHRKHQSCVKVLIEHGADPSLKNDKDQTAADLTTDAAVLALLPSDTQQAPAEAKEAAAASASGFVPTYLSNPQFFYAVDEEKRAESIKQNINVTMQQPAGSSASQSQAMPPQQQQQQAGGGGGGGSGGGGSVPAEFVFGEILRLRSDMEVLKDELRRSREASNQQAAAADTCFDVNVHIGTTVRRVIGVHPGTTLAQLLAALPNPMAAMASGAQQLRLFADAQNGIVIPTQTCGQLRGHLQADADPKTAMDLYLGLE